MPSRYAITTNRTGLTLPIIGRVRYSFWVLFVLYILLVLPSSFFEEFFEGPHFKEAGFLSRFLRELLSGLILNKAEADFWPRNWIMLGRLPTNTSLLLSTRNPV